MVGILARPTDIEADGPSTTQGAQGPVLQQAQDAQSRPSAASFPSCDESAQQPARLDAAEAVE
jgi:hypothetical protein